MRSANRPQRTAIVAAIAFIGAGCVVEVAPSLTPAGGPAFNGAAEDTVELVRVIDGDSVEFRIDSEKIETRIRGVNAPELFEQNDTRSCNGEQAKLALEQLLTSADLEVSGSEADRFGRLLVDVTADGVDVVDELIDAGWMLVVDDNRSRREAVVSAWEDERGMFGPSCGVVSNDRLLISDIEANPKGRDESNLGEEWVELHNDSEQDIDMAGWILRDETTSNQFDMTGAILSPGAKLKVRTGEGRSTDSDFYLGESHPVWSNQNETVLLIDPNGVVGHVKFLIGVGE